MQNKSIWLTAPQACAMLARHGCLFSISTFHTYLCRGKLAARKKIHPRNGQIHLYHRGDLLKSLSEKATIEKLTDEGYVTAQDLYQEDCNLRKRFGISERANVASFKTFLWQNKIPKKRIRGNLNLYHKEEALNTIYKKYSDAVISKHCNRHSRKSIQSSHLHATQAILDNPNYQPLDFLKACGVTKARIARMVKSFIIIPYFDTQRKCLLYPVQEIIHRANHYTLKTIRTRLGNKYAQHIKATRPSIRWDSPLGVRRIYYCPECTEKRVSTTKTS